MDQSGSYGQVPGNTIIGAQGQNVTPASQVPTGEQMSLIQKAGRRGRRGGFLGEVINQAIVPFTLLGSNKHLEEREAVLDAHADDKLYINLFVFKKKFGPILFSNLLIFIYSS
jgi:hypothetical protein